MANICTFELNACFGGLIKKFFMRLTDHELCLQRLILYLMFMRTAMRPLDFDTYKEYIVLKICY